MLDTEVKTLIIGSGPAGYSAAIYAARAALNPLLICGIQKGGQLTITTDVENYPGFADIIQGQWLMEQMHEQANKVGTQIIEDHVSAVDLLNKPFKISTMMGKSYLTQTVIICTGAQAKWLGINSEEKYQGFGVSGCATCDGVFFKGQEVAVIGGGNTAVEEALYLTNHASKVYLIHRRDQLRAEKILQDRLFANKKIHCIWNSTVHEIYGTESPKSVTGIKIIKTDNNEMIDLPCSGVFIAIGHTPNTDLFKGQLALDKDQYILTAANSTKTSIDGVFAAGDVQDKIYRQAITAAGTGCMAALEAINYLNSL